MAESLTVYVNGRSVAVPAGSTAAVAVLLADALVPDFGLWRATGAALRHGHLLRVPSGSEWRGAAAQLSGGVRTEHGYPVPWIALPN